MYIHAKTIKNTRKSLRGRIAAAPATRVECRLMCCNFCTSCNAWISPATSVPLRSKCCRFFMDAMIFNLPWDRGGLGTGYYQNTPELGHLRYLRRHTNIVRIYDSVWWKWNWLMNCVGREDTAVGTSNMPQELVGSWSWRAMQMATQVG